MTRQRLSLFDQMFVRLETPGRPMHVGALMIFQLPAEGAAGFVRRLVDSVRAAPVAYPPWNRVLTSSSRWHLRPQTIETHAVDMEYHVRHLALPAPGDERELEQLIARLHSHPLDLRRPLWECSYIEGLQQDRFAIYLKFHHALLDGISGARMVMRSLSVSPMETTSAFWSHPQAEPPKASGPRQPKPAPRLADWLAAAVASLRLYRKSDRETDVTLRSAPRTPLNHDVGPQRRVATQSFLLARLKVVAKRANVSLNDLVLAMVGGSLRRYLLELDQLPQSSLTTGIAVSTRVPGDDSVGNAASMILATLGTDIADPVLRMERIHQSTMVAKQELQELPHRAVLPYTLLTTAPFTLGLLTGMTSQLPLLCNTLVSNVPGAEESRYLSGARLLHLYPISIVQPGQALNFTCYSYAGHLNFGITACRDTVPHLQRIAAGLETTFKELECAFGLGTPAADPSQIDKTLSRIVKRKASSTGRL